MTAPAFDFWRSVDDAAALVVEHIACAAFLLSRGEEHVAHVCSAAGQNIGAPFIHDALAGRVRELLDVRQERR